MKRLFAVLCLAGLSSTALAAPENYVIDTKHTMPRFEYSHLGYSTQTSRFDNTSGKIIIDREAKTGSVTVEIDATSVSTGSDLFNQHIQAEAFFDTANYPKITFKSSKMQFEGDQPSAVEGELTIKGVTKAVTLTINHFKCMPHPMFKKQACGADAITTIKRSDFAMSKHVPYVSDEVKLIIPVEAVKE